MRRTVGIVLAALGVISLVGAILIWGYVAPNLVKLPTDTEVRTVATGKGSGLDLTTGVPFKDVDLKATRHLTSDEADDDTVIWTMKVKLTTPFGTALTEYTDRVAVDREDVRAVNDKKYGEKIDDAKLGPRDVKHKGLSYHFPFHTKKSDYAFFDVNTGKAFLAKYDGKEELDDLKVYKFTQDVPATKIRQADVPGAALGSSAKTVKADVYYTNLRTFWVEPVSGWIVKASETAKTTLRAPGSDKDAVVVLANTLTFDDETVDDLSDQAEDDKEKIDLLEKYIPAAALVAGIVLLVLGLVLIFLRRKPQGEGATPNTDSAADEAKKAEASEPKDVEPSETKAQDPKAEAESPETKTEAESPEADEPSSTEDKPKTD